MSCAGPSFQHSCISHHLSNTHADLARAQKLHAANLHCLSMSDGKSKPLPPAVEGSMVVGKLGEAIRNHLGQATETERQRCLEQLSAWVADREKEDRDKYDARVARGEPAPSPFARTPTKADATSSDTKDTTAEHATQVEACLQTPPRPTKARTPSPPRRRRRTKSQSQNKP